MISIIHFNITERASNDDNFLFLFLNILTNGTGSCLIQLGNLMVKFMTIQNPSGLLGQEDSG